MSVFKKGYEAYDMITIDRLSHANALDPEHLRALIKLIEQADPHRLLVLTGAGGVFSAGMDTRYLAMATQQEVVAMSALFGELLQVWDAFAGENMVYLNGPVVGGACGLMLAARWRIAHTSCYFCCPELDYGWWPTQLYPYFAREFSENLVRLWLWGQPISAEMALSQGVLTAVDQQDCLSCLANTYQKMTLFASMVNRLQGMDKDPQTLAQLFASRYSPVE